MIEISLNKINKSYGFNPILKDFSFEIKSGERIALIGPNGCGKTTTLRIIMGEDIDSGSINIRKGANTDKAYALDDKFLSPLCTAMGFFT